MKKLLVPFLLLLVFNVQGQHINESFNSAFKEFAGNSLFTHSTISLYVINTTTGKTVTDVNTNIGVAPASCQKVITASTAFELLGHDYTYKTTIGYTGKIVDGILNGDIIIKGSGDPTLGSWRYQQTREDKIIATFQDDISKQGIKEIKGNVYADESLWNEEATPRGWIWEDIGNYYGAGARAINWRENQYDLFLKSGKNIGDAVESVGTKPSYVSGLNLKIMATSAGKGTGDNTYIFMPLNDQFSYVRGTIPVNENHFSVSGAMPHPAVQLALTLEAALKKLPIEKIAADYPGFHKAKMPVHIFYTYTSPVLDSIVFHFLRRSINLYGESLIKTLGYEMTKIGATDSGVNVIKRFWKDKGIEPSAMNIIDGSGLSPANRITTQTLVTVMEYAKKQKWFPSFYNALPVINGIKMKSGSIGGVLSYTGFIKSKSGEQYTFAFVINNYDGDSHLVRTKMWQLLDLLK
ncbi:MAG: D-alanyl-D-alanine carboxypeptidase/D-alanyl-D-alanine-endopeptidase [Bacteroidota bacterium]|nr:D-alanyl-D-alanine carboxypeptidase/D-alanyl-D-alanine-endopeptidase [Bacteroidota bacterium]